jgi:hypothetical protein
MRTTPAGGSAEDVSAEDDETGATTGVVGAPAPHAATKRRR